MSWRGTGVDEGPSAPLGVKTQLQGPKLGSAVSVEAARIGSDVDGAQGEGHIDQPTSATNVVVDMVEGGTTYLHNPEKEEASSTFEPPVPAIDCEEFAPLKKLSPGTHQTGHLQAASWSLVSREWQQGTTG